MLVQQEKKKLSGLHINIMYCLLWVQSLKTKKNNYINQGLLVPFSRLFLLYIFYIHPPGNSMKQNWEIHCFYLVDSINKMLLFIYTIYLLKGNVLEVLFILIENIYMKMVLVAKKKNQYSYRENNIFYCWDSVEFCIKKNCLF